MVQPLLTTHGLSFLQDTVEVQEVRASSVDYQLLHDLRSSRNTQSSSVNQARFFHGLHIYIHALVIRIFGLLIVCSAIYTLLLMVSSISTVMQGNYHPVTAASDVSLFGFMGSITPEALF